MSAVDGPPAAGKPHPRSYGTFACVLGHYARDKGVLPLQEAVRKMTSAPAQRLRLWERALIGPGMKADLVVFDPETVGDKTTYLDPFQYAEGIKLVVVNGRITVQDGRHTGEKAGRVLRRQAQAATSRGAHRPKHNDQYGGGTR